VEKAAVEFSYGEKEKQIPLSARDDNFPSPARRRN
jgi:hypothetical protein